MKISVGTNLFGNSNRQRLGIESQCRLKQRNSEIINLYAFQKNNNENFSEMHQTRLITRDSRDFVENGKKTSPCIKDIFDGLAETNCDYFVYANSDIIFGDNFLKYLLDGNFTGYACSRMDIMPINDLRDSIVPFRYEIAGQDVFVVKKDWYLRKRNIFKEYLIGSIWYDTAITCLLKQYGQNDPIINHYPVQITHIHHGWGSGLPSPENSYNTKLYESESSKIRDPWAWYYHNILTQRTNGANMFNLFPNEKQIEKEFFDKHLIKD
jgi:hypothetical protein